jgi:hypothetical protein
MALNSLLQQFGIFYASKMRPQEALFATNKKTKLASNWKGTAGLAS